jgi:hypothetical protein
MDGVWYRPGFTNRPNQKAIERIVDAYLNLISSGNRLRQERKYLEKSIIIINKILGHPCCDIADSVIDFGTPYDNQITNALKAIFFAGQPVRRSFRYALFRMLAKFNVYLYGCCTTTLTITYSDALPANVTVNFTDVVSGTVLFTTTTTGGTTQTITLPSQWFGPGVLIQACINVINAPGSGSYELVDPNDNIVVESAIVGDTCASTLGPLQASYTVTT